MDQETAAMMDLAQQWSKGKKTEEKLLELYLMQLHTIGLLTSVIDHFGLTAENLSRTIPLPENASANTGGTGNSTAATG